MHKVGLRRPQILGVDQSAIDNFDINYLTLNYLKQFSILIPKIGYPAADDIINALKVRPLFYWLETLISRFWLKELTNN